MKQLTFRFLACLVVFLSICNYSLCQVQATTECGTEIPLCNIDELDGFRGTLPSMLQGDYPDDFKLCDKNSGDPNNLSWFSFVAGADSIDLTIIPSNCTSVPDGASTISGIQVGMFSNCDYSSYDNRLACGNNCTKDAKPVDIAAGNLTIGATYYLFVDGCGGSVCDYEVKVNYGKQPFQMPEFETISNDFSNNLNTDTICQGANIRFEIEKFNASAKFEWTITSKNEMIQADTVTVDDSTFVNLTFSNRGMFEVCVQADNECDKNEQTCFEVVVDSLPSERFSPIDVCQGCLPIILDQSDETCVINNSVSIPTILDEDPNGDGVKGWQGATKITGGGLVENIVAAKSGCIYKQFVDVNVLRSGESYDTTVYVCKGGFPFDFLGKSIPEPTNNFVVKLKNMAVSGCDSLISLSAIEIGAGAEIVKGNCSPSGIELILNLGNSMPENTILTYVWKDSKGTEIPNNNGIETTRFITQDDVYTVECTADIEGSVCSFSVSSADINFSNLKPNAPVLGSDVPKGDVCNDGQLVKLYVDQSTNQDYNWVLTPASAFAQDGLTKDTIYVNLDGLDEFKYCVEAVDDCGTSSQTCDSLVISQALTEGRIVVDGVNCKDSIRMISYEGNVTSSTTFNWDFGNGTVVSKNANDKGPHKVSYTTSDNITLTLSAGACSDVIINETVEVVSQDNPPTIVCNASLNEIAFAIEANDYSVVVLDGEFTDSSTVSNVLTFEGVTSDALTIEVSIKTPCGVLTSEQSCQLFECTDKDVALSVDAGVTKFCEGDQEVTITAALDGVNHNTGIWSGATTDGILKLDNTGVQTVYYTVMETGGCAYEDSITLEVLPKPELTSDMLQMGCEDITISVQLTASDVGTFYLGNQSNDTGFFENVGTATYIARFESSNGCSSEELSVQVDVQEISFTLNGPEILTEGEDGSFKYSTNIKDVTNVLWRQNAEIICDAADCTEEISITPMNGDSICVALTYGDGCMMELCQSVEVVQPTEIYVPNVFSPNGDRINDYFYPVSNVRTVKFVKMTIFDRWGDCVFSEKNFSMSEEPSGWNGTYNGTEMYPGVYTYVVDYIDHKGKMQRIVGDITLVR